MECLLWASQLPFPLYKQFSSLTVQGLVMIADLELQFSVYSLNKPIFTVEISGSLFKQKCLEFTSFAINFTPFRNGAKICSQVYMFSMGKLFPGKVSQYGFLNSIFTGRISMFATELNHAILV